MYSDYDCVDEYEYEYGDTCYYYDEGEYWMIVYVCSSLSSDGGTGGNPDDGYDDGQGGGSTGGGSVETDVELLTNNGKGLPTETDGIYDVDFTKATYVKDVTDQGYYLDGCPTKGQVKVLVIPVEFKDITAASKGYTVEKIDLAFNGGAGSTDYHSVSEYYNISSYGQLDLDFVVLDEWFRPQYNSSHYKNSTMEYDGTEVENGDQLIIDEALAALESKLDLSSFDSDGNDIIDAVVLINTLDIDSETNFEWAYRYWNILTDNEGYYYEYDGVSANDYLWASYQFMLETYDANGNAIYKDNVMNTYTYIHEFGHVLGADDYYDTAYVNEPLAGYDVMDMMLGDHNAYTKFNYGWLTKARLIVAQESVTLTIKDFSQNGDVVIIANDWDEKLGVYQEYFIVVYYTNTGLNGGDEGYFEEDGIVVYHVNASLYKEVYDGETLYDVYYNNTDISDENGYGTEENLIELVSNTTYGYTYGVGESLSSSVKTDAGEKIAYTFTVNALTADGATVTFRKNA